jgi:hypothetical protein
MSQESQRLEPVNVNGRVYFERQKLERYKRALLSQALGTVATEPAKEVEPAIVELVPAARAARELGVHRRTLGRRIAAARGHEAVSSRAVG